jgi:hypothetical protein
MAPPEDKEEEIREWRSGEVEKFKRGLRACQSLFLKRQLSPDGRLTTVD